MIDPTKVALIHDFLNQAGGAERVVAALHRLFPTAPIYTTIVDWNVLWPSLRDADIRASWMQWLPGLKRHFKKYVLLYPFAIESVDLREYDLVISSSSAFAKGAVVRPDALHVCYCHTPMRFAWDFNAYVDREHLGRTVRIALGPVIRFLRRWDLRTKDRPMVYVANSTVVRERIRRLYGRPSELVYPPVELPTPAATTTLGDYHLVVSRLNGYKRIDLAIDAFNALGWPLVVIGDGPQRHALEARAGPRIHFLGRVPDATVAEYYACCRGLVVPGAEDFGIAPLEANLAGRPVIAYRDGGALDTVVDGHTGIFFEVQTPAALADAVRRCEAVQWNPAELRHHAERFSEAVFRDRMLAVIDRALDETRHLASRDSASPCELQPAALPSVEELGSWVRTIPRH